MKGRPKRPGWVKIAGAELVGLFVDDARFALLVLLCTAGCGLLLPWAGLPRAWAGPALFVALAALLIETALRRARAARRN